jgi:hypothetical protein
MEHVTGENNGQRRDGLHSSSDGNRSIRNTFASPYRIIRRPMTKYFAIFASFVIISAYLGQETPKAPAPATDTPEVSQTLNGEYTVTFDQGQFKELIQAGKTPEFKCYQGCTFPAAYDKAFTYIKSFANTDEFESYFLKKRTKLSHVEGKTPQQVMKIFREQLSQGDVVEISFYWNPFSTGIGAWDVTRIKENRKYNYAPVPLAAHLLHEVSHKYKWQHQGNYKTQFDNLNSFPYAVGDEFLAFLREKGL